MEEYPQVTKGRSIHRWPSVEGYPQVEREVYPQMAKGGGYPQGAKAYIAIDRY